MKKQFITLVLILLISVSFSQITTVPGYIIRSTGDTIEGDIKINPKKNFEYYTKVSYKDAQNNKVYKPDDINGYGFKDNNFISNKLNEEPFFYKVLCNGKVMLYELMYKGVTANADYVSDYFIAKKGETNFTRVKQGKTKKQLAEYMKDKPDVLNSFDDSKFEIEKLISVVNKYNS